MSQNVLITGGTGMIGRRLTELLLERGYSVSYLSRSKDNIPNVTVYRWELDRGYIEDEALERADHLILLAGAGIADERWTDKRKQEIINSRTRGIEIIAKELQGRSYQLKSCVAASAIGYYGADTGDEQLSETHTSGTDFLAHVTRHWEKATEKIENTGLRTVRLRIGIVLSEEGGALPKLTLPIRYGVGAPLSSGKQWSSWIHLDDLCALFIKAIEDPRWQGVYNAVAPQPVTNAELTRQIADLLHRPLWLPNIPAFALRLLYGEMADVVLGGNYVLNERVSQTDFGYKFAGIRPALEDLLT